MTIKKATLSNLPRILELNLELFKFEKQYGDSYSLEWTFSDTGKSYFKTRIRQDLVFVAYDNFKDRIVGYICGYKYVHKARNPQNIAEIENMFVEETYRGRGVGSRLITLFEMEAKKLGVQRLKVSAILQNEWAIKFYQKVKFKKHEIVLEKDLTETDNSNMLKSFE